MWIYYQIVYSEFSYIGEFCMKLIKLCSLLFILILFAVILLSCRTIAGQPQILKASIVPSEIKPGDKVLIEAVVKDRHYIVRKVECTVKEDPRAKIRLNDNGMEPDKKANDGVWCVAVEVPDETPKGKFNLEITAYRKDGESVFVRTKSGEIEVLKETLAIEIK